MRDPRVAADASHRCYHLVERLLDSDAGAHARLWALYDSAPESPLAGMTVNAILDHALADALGALPAFVASVAELDVQIATAEDLEILRRLGQDVRSDSALQPANETSLLLLGLCRQESVEAFRAMTKSRFGTVRERGARALAALGEVVPPPPPAAAARVRVDLKGAPAMRRISWTISNLRGQTSSSAALDQTRRGHAQRQSAPRFRRAQVDPA